MGLVSWEIVLVQAASSPYMDILASSLSMQQAIHMHIFSNMFCCKKLLSFIDEDHHYSLVKPIADEGKIDHLSLNMCFVLLEAYVYVKMNLK